MPALCVLAVTSKSPRTSSVTGDAIVMASSAWKAAVTSMGRTAPASAAAHASTSASHASTVATAPVGAAVAVGLDVVGDSDGAGVTVGDALPSVGAAVVGGSVSQPAQTCDPSTRNSYSAGAPPEMSMSLLTIQWISDATASGSSLNSSTLSEMHPEKRQTSRLTNFHDPDASP